jgi:integrase
MASIRKRGSAWQARVTRKGFPSETQTFKSRIEAERWCRTVETSMDEGSFVSPRPAQELLFADLLARYRETVTPTKRGAKEEVFRLKAIERTRMAQLAVAYITPAVIADYRDMRLRDCCPDTVIRDLAVLSSIFNHGIREWGLRLINPVSLVRKPKAGQGRDRVISSTEEHDLLINAQAEGRRNPLLPSLIILALETAMRRGELLSLRWDGVNLGSHVAYLAMTKNGRPRTVPLSSRAVDTLKGIAKTDDLVFPWNAPAVHKAFERLCQRAGFLDLRFHDLRHTATTRLATKLPNVIELAAVTGHQSIQILKRYYHPSAESLASKIA